MSNDQEKNLNSTRRSKDELAIKKQLKIAKQHGTLSDDNKIVKEPHRLAKRHAMDCGNTQCQLCSREKVFKRPTVQQKRFDQDIEYTRDKRSNGSDPEEK